ncbi:MAG: BlaI/MecI/CopY family transcriptional regulator [Phycisphaerales bacterium]|nr:BlaI/MecI/CopY family transcriptional regulator [Phycisphaerales bacterium]
MSANSLANAELSVMELLWDHGSLTARQIQDKLYGESDRSQHGTVQRLLQRLEGKELVEREKVGAANSFSTRISREQYAASQLQSIIQRLTGGSIAPLLSHLIDQKRLSRAELRRLRALLDGGKP